MASLDISYLNYYYNIVVDVLSIDLETHSLL